VTGDCIQSILDQDRPDIDIIVSGNGSDDGSVDSIREQFPSVQIIENGKNIGFDSAVNRDLSDLNQCDS